MAKSIFRHTSLALRRRSVNRKQTLPATPAGAGWRVRGCWKETAAGPTGDTSHCRRWHRARVRRDRVSREEVGTGALKVPFPISTPNCRRFAPERFPQRPICFRLPIAARSPRRIVSRGAAETRGCRRERAEPEKRAVSVHRR